MKAWIRLQQWVKAPMFSPSGFLVRAAALAVLYGILSMAGLRSYMSALSLTFPEGASRGFALFACGLYLLSYFSFILGVPILVLGSGLMALLNRLSAASRP